MWPFKKKKNKEELQERELKSEIGREIYKNIQEGYYIESFGSQEKPCVLQNNDICLTIPFLPYSGNKDYARLREIYYGNTSALKWYERFEELADEIAKIKKPEKLEDKAYLRKLKEALNELKENKLAYEFEIYSAYREPAQQVFSRLERLVA